MRLFKVCGSVLVLALASIAQADHSTPKSAAEAFAVAVRDGDSETVQQYIHGADEDKKSFGVLADMIKSIFKMEEAAVAKFGEDAKGFSGSSSGDDMVEQVKRAEVTENGDTATLTIPDQTEPFDLVRVDGKWYVDIAKLKEQEDITQSLPIFEAITGASKQLTTDIEADKYASLDDLKTAYQTEVQKAVMEAFAKSFEQGAHEGHDHGDHEHHEGDGHDHSNEGVTEEAAEEPATAPQAQ